MAAALLVISILASIILTASAHGGVTSYKIAGKAYTGWQPYNDPGSQVSIERPYSSYNPYAPLRVVMKS
jgi:hypothetical protein